MAPRRDDQSSRYPSAWQRDVLNLLGLTQAEMAELLGVSVRTAHGYANGARIPEPVARFLALTLSKYQRGRSPAAAEAKP